MGNIYINGRFLTQPVTGVQRYCRELLGTLDEMISTGEVNASDRQLICLVPRNLEDYPQWKHIRIRKVGRFSGNLWEQFELPFFVRNGLLFSPANIGPYITSGQVVTMHDASVFAVPQAYSRAFRFKYRLIFRKLGKTAKKVITVSEFSKHELVKYCHIDPQKIVVILHGHEHLLRTVADNSIIQQQHLVDKPYFLTAGSRSPHKNFKVILDALRYIPDAQFNLVIAGGSFEKVFQGEALQLPTNVIHAGYVSDGQLRALYEHAQAFIFPSLYEGFGLPVLEALSFSCPVICSNAASLSEVGGNVVMYFDPRDARGLGKIMQGFLPVVSRQMMDERVARFTWRKSVLETWKEFC